MIGHIDIAETGDSVSATTVVAAPAEVIFDYLRHPANHREISGDGTVRGTNGGEERLELGSRFGMKMKLGVPYRISSKVVELEEDRLIAWAHFGGHRWRWTLEPLPDGTTRVTETFDQSTAKFPPALRLAGYPGRHRDNVETSVRNVAARFVGM
ncbi:MAG: SRPBCC family protein [Ilumatobacteraceae bacterium]